MLAVLAVEVLRRRGRAVDDDARDEVCWVCLCWENLGASVVRNKRKEPIPIEEPEDMV